MGIITNEMERGIREGIIANTSCVSAYTDGLNVVFPERGHVFSPWVAIAFVDTSNNSNAATITVSNRSSEATNPKHCAVIKSMELGHSNGFGVKVVIHDTQGGSFEQFMRHLLMDWNTVKDTHPSSIFMKIQFGWAKNGCSAPLPRSASPPYFVACTGIESSYSEGKFVFEIQGDDLAKVSFEGAVEWQQGGEGQEGMHLLHAITTLMCDSVAPNLAKVTFKTLHGQTVVTSSSNPNNPSSRDPLLFKASTRAEQQYGPKGKWDAKGQTKIDVVRRWLDECPSINGNSWVAQYDPTTEDSQLVIWENALPMCNDQPDSFFDATSLGTYIVNGGPSSPVIEFNPKIRWDWAAVVGAGGQMSDQKLNGLTTDGAKNPGAECLPRSEVEGAGGLTQTNPSDFHKDYHGSNSLTENAHSDAVAKKTISHYDDIAADLVIIGDPTFCPPSLAVGTRNISIVMINPFHLVPSSSSCGEYLSQPPCNAILSNKGWIITSVTHRIEAGVYTTTIGVKLAAPGKSLPADSHLGGWTGGWKPKAN